MTSDTISVERTIKATPEQIFALVADAARHADIDGSGTVRGTRQASRPLTLGSTFGMAMHMGVGYRTSNTVVEFEQDRRIAWKTTGMKGLVGGRIWRYELEPVDGGTLVRESWDVSQDKQKFLLKRSRMAPAAKAGMRKTLERIASNLEA
ncbi:dimethyladenosine transferase [Aeromicrobium sp. A1-2]|uniref:SRPBCC family protein n=1 Tax=Aeromicrobium sp. A1-2 TaxID=2107713 RepID=UPI000E47E9E0|nr:SRPBCC family protein [Aeromicrobium sp. A1-2]AXT86141.1 dimethyladenosine transferase [Aeromicrobium sp. A1-2]